MLAFTLFLAAFVLPFLLIGGLLVTAMQHHRGDPPPLFRESLIAIPAYQDSNAQSEPPEHLRVPSSYVPGVMWTVHLN